MPPQLFGFGFWFFLGFLHVFIILQLLFFSYFSTHAPKGETYLINLYFLIRTVKLSDWHIVGIDYVSDKVTNPVSIMKEDAFMISVACLSLLDSCLITMQCHEL